MASSRVYVYDFLCRLCGYLFETTEDTKGESLQTRLMGVFSVFFVITFFENTAVSIYKPDKTIDKKQCCF